MGNASIGKELDLCSDITGKGCFCAGGRRGDGRQRWSFTHVEFNIIKRDFKFLICISLVCYRFLYENFKYIGYKIQYTHFNNIFLRLNTFNQYCTITKKIKQVVVNML